MITQPMVTASYYFHEATKRAVQLALRRRAEKSHGTPQARTWRTLSENLARPGYLPIVSVIGPRWNCHAQIASLGPIQVKQTLACRVESLRGAAESWSIVVYDDVARTVAWAGSAKTDGDAVEWHLRPGRYSLIMRVYSDSDETVVPDVMVDGQSLSCGRTIHGEAGQYDRYLESIRDKSGWYYRLLHYYTFHHLKHASRPRDWVRSHFIPVGNPDTEWHYGHLDPGDCLQVYFDLHRNETVNTYISFYNWASFPVHWCKVTGPRWSSPTFEQPVAYAIRRVKTGPAQAGAETGPFELRVLSASEQRAAVAV